ncbi:uncharacterized protein LOC118180971, partial [Stegodyphus dumicola]|uniref:uncharacterized protein LOC118180971 n=1 Tax=Stegodyphus dumicola TaxID=202533 RepID=UPI0015AF7D4C
MSEDRNTISQEILPTNIDNPVNLILIHSSAGSIKCTQINLQRAEAANTQLVQHVLDHEIDIILLQQPYCRNGAIACLPLSWKMFQRKAQLNELPPRAAIICCNPQWSPLIIKQARDHDAILLNYNISQIILSSIYSPPPEDISNAVDSIAEIHREHTTIPHVISGDLNAHNVIWGYPDTSPKGTALEEFIMTANLQLINTQNVPSTFDKSYNKGWPDLRIATSNIANNITDWMVTDDESCSDHKYIHFAINTDTSITILKRYKIPGKKLHALTKAFSDTLQSEEE